ncbi:helix-turn-helix domain-containing protein [Butyrivibrio sp. INlla21]|uniref:helix-turn-helix domain-containing protein n=1 Tax=Butyrivibrio sp. INlla21 TaxID=1520811 RepID=UPI0008E2186A|nr:helix-turn-helix domain-containing protein [Butyrivibrio sp. INlla21]SFU91464.1 Zein-binding [Butyrivibrio sp. INlla21]
MITTLDDALKRISELEEENSKLKEELKYYKSKKFAGRQKHDEHWMQSYNNFVIQYEDGMTIMEIVDKGEISRRTAYRYKAYYERLKKMQEK